MLVAVLATMVMSDDDGHDDVVDDGHVECAVKDDGNDYLKLAINTNDSQ